MLLASIGTAGGEASAHLNKLMWVNRISSFAVNGLSTYVLVSIFRTEPTKIKLCYATVGVATGYLAGKNWFIDDVSIAPLIGHPLGATYGFIKPGEGFCLLPQRVETSLLLMGGFLLGF